MKESNLCSFVRDSLLNVGTFPSTSIVLVTFLEVYKKKGKISKPISELKSPENKKILI